MGISGERSAILRAEILRDGHLEVTCAIEMKETSIFIISESLPPLGHSVRLHLSFPRMLKPLVVDGIVSQIRMGGGPGSPAGYFVEFVVPDDTLRQRIAEIARRLRPTAGALANRELSILLVEDNQLLRDTFAYAFERYFRSRTAGVKLLQASTTAEAWALAQPDTDLLLVDHVLKGEAGTSFVSRVRGDSRLGRVFIVGMSGSGATARRAMLDAGADLFLDKPIVLKDLFLTLEFLTGSPASWREYGAA